MHTRSEFEPISSYGVGAPCCCTFDVAACDAVIYATDSESVSVQTVPVALLLHK
jgi:pyrimidine deaminase RibD-like protein